LQHPQRDASLTSLQKLSAFHDEPERAYRRAKRHLYRTCDEGI
jgi:hypothetical protein